MLKKKYIHAEDGCLVHIDLLVSHCFHKLAELSCALALYKFAFTGQT